MNRHRNPAFPRAQESQVVGIADALGKQSCGQIVDKVIDVRVGIDVVAPTCFRKMAIFSV